MLYEDFLKLKKRQRNEFLVLKKRIPYRGLWFDEAVFADQRGLFESWYSRNDGRSRPFDDSYREDVRNRSMQHIDRRVDILLYAILKDTEGQDTMTLARNILAAPGNSYSFFQPLSREPSNGIELRLKDLILAFRGYDVDDLRNRKAEIRRDIGKCNIIFNDILPRFAV